MFNSNKKVKNINENIMSWHERNETILNIVSPPYNHIYMFKELVETLVRKNKRILFISNNINHKEIELFKNEFKQFKNLEFLNCEFYKQPKGQYDLIIYDDVSSFSKFSKYEIQLLLSYICFDSKIITYSIEPIFYNCSTILNLIGEDNLQIIEPRFINTRVDICNEIPYSVFEYIYWSIERKNKVLIYCPNEEKGKMVLKSLKAVKSINVSIGYLNEGDNEIVAYSDDIIVTHIHDSFEEIRNSFNMIIYFANDKFFNYKKLLFLVGKAIGEERDFTSEVIFLSKEISDDMERAKNITRKFNKRAWEIMKG